MDELHDGPVARLSLDPETRHEEPAALLLCGDAADDQAIDSSFDVAALPVTGIARQVIAQVIARQIYVVVAGQVGGPITRLLPRQTPGIQPSQSPWPGSLLASLSALACKGYRAWRGQAKRGFGKRPMMLLMLNVAIFIRRRALSHVSTARHYRRLLVESAPGAVLADCPTSSPLSPS